MTPVSSKCSSSWCGAEASDGNDLLRGLAEEKDDVARLRPSAATPLGLRDFVMREERAGVAWKDMSASVLLDDGALLTVPRLGLQVRLNQAASCETK